MNCGSCSACCKVLRIAELDKAPDTWCPNFKKGCGCTIYADRPNSCRGFKCLWLMSQETDTPWEEAMRPDKLKVIFDVQGKDLILHMDKAYTYRVNDPRVEAQAKSIAEKGDYGILARSGSDIVRLK